MEPNQLEPDAVPEFKGRIVQGLRDAVMLTDLTGKILDVNPAFERLFGYTRDDIVGETASVLKSGHHDLAFFHHLWQSICKGMTWEGNIYNKRKDGSILMVEETITPLFDGGGQIELFLATMRENIMYGWQSEKGHKVLPQRDAMTATLAHDLSNLITPLLGSAGTAKMKLESGDDPTDEIDRICTAGQRAKELLRQVLAFCRHEYNDKRDPVSISHIVRDVISILEADIADEITIETEFLQNNAVVPGDSIQLHQVLMNLCTNSLNAMMGTGGALKITLENMVINNNSPYLGDLRKGDYIKMSIIDNGVGMDQESIRRAFDPYFSTRSDRGAGEGHGLGLSIVRKVIEGHQGKVYLKSSPGNGCTVDVILPNGSGQAMTQTQQIPVAVLPVRFGTIMLVDDERSIRQMGKNMLEYIGYSVVGFGGGEEALEFFLNQPNDFDLIITDQVMPGIKGTTFAHEVRNIRPDIPIIFISGFANKFPEDALVTLGNCMLLSKPFASDELLDAVRNLVVE
ncbi:hypothetical protein BVX99_02315 [bacterium F16]|nr:hypothetical protein BVX99_02315 [bacterium F16]